MKRLIIILAILSSFFVAYAHEAECPYCTEAIVQNTEKQDNEVVLKVGNKRIEYRCLYCVIKDHKRYKGDLTVYAPSEKVAKPLVIRRVDGKWTGPEKMVILNTFKKHEQCAALSRAFTNKAAFDAYVADNKVTGAKPLTLKEFIELLEKPAAK